MTTAKSWKLERRFSFSTVERARDNRPADQRMTLSALAQMLRHDGERVSAKDGRGIIGATFSEPLRRAEKAERVEILLIDIDDAEGSPLELLAELGSSAHIRYSTWSHGDPKKWKPGRPRFRALFPLSRAVSPEEYRLLWRGVNALLGGICDASTKDVSRLMYTPRQKNPDAVIEPWIEENAGELLDVETLLELERKKDQGEQRRNAQKRRRAAQSFKETGTTQEEEKRLLDALRWIGADDRDTWLRVGMALHEWSGGGARGETVWEAWSQQSSKYDPKIQKRTWSGFGKSGGPRVTLGSVFHDAKAAGWRPPRTKIPSTPRAQESYRLPLVEARARLAKRMQSAIAKGGRYAFICDPGIGKTTEALEGILDTFEKGGRAKYVAESNDLLTQKRGELLELALRRVHAESWSVDLYQRLERNVMILPKRTKENCEELLTYQAAERAMKGGGRKMCEGCPLRRGCDYVRERSRRQQHRISMTTYALELLTNAEREEDEEENQKIDLMVIDECALTSCFNSVSCDLDALLAWSAEGVHEWKGGAFKTLVDFLSLGADERAKIGPDDLREPLERGSVRFTGENPVARGAFDAGNRLPKLSAKRKAWNAAPDWRAAEALEYASNLGWAGSAITFDSESKATLTLPTRRAFNIRQAKTVLYLDATACADTAKLVVPEAESLELRLEMPRGTTIRQTNRTIGSKRGTFSSDVSTRRYLGTRKAYDDEQTLLVLPKAWRAQSQGELGGEELSEAQSIHIEADAAGRVIHQGGTEARGSNQYKHLDGVILNPYFVPTLEKKRLASHIEEERGWDGGRCDDLVTRQLELAPMVQALHRIRPLLSESGNRITLLDSRDFRGFGIEPTEPLFDPDLLALDAFGEMREHGLITVLEGVRRVIENNGGAWCPKHDQIGDLRRLRGGVKGTCNPSKGYIYDLHVPLTPPPEDAARAVLAHKLANHFGNSFQKLAQALGCFAYRYRTSSGGEEVILTFDELDIVQIERVLRSRGVTATWFEVNEERRYLCDPLADVKAASIALEWDPMEMSASAFKAEMCALMGVSMSTLKRRLSDLREETVSATGREAAQTVWRRANRELVLAQTLEEAARETDPVWREAEPAEAEEMLAESVGTRGALVRAGLKREGGVELFRKLYEHCEAQAELDAIYHEQWVAELDGYRSEPCSQDLSTLLSDPFDLVAALERYKPPIPTPRTLLFSELAA